MSLFQKKIANKCQVHIFFITFSNALKWAD